MARPKGSKNKARTVKASVDYVAVIAEKAAKKEKIESDVATLTKKGEAEDVLKKLLASGMTAEEILAKLQ